MIAGLCYSLLFDMLYEYVVVWEMVSYCLYFPCSIDMIVTFCCL